MPKRLPVILHRRFCWRLSESQGRFAARIPNRAVRCEPSFEHAQQHRYFMVNVVVYPDFCLAGVKPMQTAGILDQSSPPGNGHSQEERI